jgi:hypothetical protein
MLRSSFTKLLRPLVAAVQVQHAGSAVWETMAAFDVYGIARSYARDCAKENEHCAYRIISIDEERPEGVAR